MSKARRSRQNQGRNRPGAGRLSSRRWRWTDVRVGPEMRGLRA